MSYTIVLDLGIVVRNSDGKTVSPCQSVDDQDFVRYAEWVLAGNEPLEVNSGDGSNYGTRQNN